MRSSSFHIFTYAISEQCDLLLFSDNGWVDGPSKERADLLARAANESYAQNMNIINFSRLQIYLRPGKVPFATMTNIRLAC